MRVQVCVGSSCHLKGSHEVVIRLQELIRDNVLEGEVELAASFCMGNCAKGVSVMVDDQLMDFVTPDNVEEFFNERILKAVRG